MASPNLQDGAYPELYHLGIIEATREKALSFWSICFGLYYVILIIIYILKQIYKSTDTMFNIN